MKKKKPKKKKSQPAENAELSDLKLLFWIAVAVLGTWWLLPDVLFSRPLMHHDGLLLLPRIQEYLDLGDWRKFVYRADTMGGVAFVDVYGKPLIYSFLSYFNIKAQTAMNMALMFTQITIAFLAIRSSISLSKKWSPEAEPLKVASIIGMTLLFAFIPVLGSRAQYGHLEIIWGLELFLIMLSVGLSAQNSDFTRVQWLVVLLTLFHCVPALGQQTKTYSVVFGSIILIPIFWSGPFKKKLLVLVSAMTLGSVFAVLPRFYGMLAYAASSDPARGFGSESVVYSYPGTNFMNWLASLTWNYKLFQTTQDVNLISEFHFPFGPLILFLVALYFLSRRILLGAIISLFLALAFTLKWEPIASLLQILIPPLKMFRIPEKSVLTFALSIPIFAVSIFLAKLPRKNTATSWMLCVGLSVAVIFLPPMWREVLLWVLAATLLVFILRKKIPQTVTLPAVLLVFGIGSALSYSVWIQQAPDKTADIKKLKRVGTKLNEAKSEFKSDLSRTLVGFKDGNFVVITALAADLSSLSGYWHPLARFAKLGAALDQTEYNPTYTYYPINPSSKSWPVMRQLYNVCCEVLLEQNNGGGEQLRVRDLGPTLGPAWFSEYVVWKDSWVDLASELPAAIPNDLLMLEFDEMARAAKTELSADFKGCKDAKVLEHEMGADRQTFIFKTSAPKDCPMTVAMNYSEMLKARTDSGENLKLFPGNGALTSIVVPAGEQEITVYAQAYEPVWIKALGYLGLLMFFVGLYFLPKFQKD